MTTIKFDYSIDDKNIIVKPMEIGRPLPILIMAQNENLKLKQWFKANEKLIDTLLLQYGGVLFRGFSIANEQDFHQFLSETGNELLHYNEPTSPRINIQDKVYTSTEHPSDQEILLHNEMSYSTAWPRKIWFCSVKVADEGGQTPIADMRNVFNLVPEEIRNTFIEKGWMLVRNFGNGFGLSLEQVFGSTRKENIEDYCAKNDLKFEWVGGNNLRTRQVRKAVRQHPISKENLWFNHIAFYHESSLQPQNRKLFLDWFGSEGMPYNTFYGDGTPIEDEVIHVIRNAYEQEKVVFPWQRGDVLMLDNMLVAHGRNPFKGERKTLVAMSDLLKG
ncbi:TauD/TfdA family dioxygenase [Aneurinibacillus aneurinilyticus]|uniref:Taurine catabolism dioxygenase, TauD/TfdA family n=1 Tax=Aneurinibacillus aneurinilyticus ATCC 12856 TaxID=649747 RepID=U1WB02_ANEAE|nr:TauD/TfdA family dioxygenase [Aneurinibacillus aneurinilyticus]ERI05704.1 taurine catabolism dioxygenase, TauD/TfdA family [Aneurinibacillus aneurinilyticus ATCC 12856]MED0708911.1 TauD/TfdA family dioxygenase [Aneurinibacillus aneurinilyticus]MED0722916.1 TauD/TfdA family dioxygenase [Aneurinibacillus aneurinilyticus]MED0732584.1 TauD/TfdA family dioxygenase [Aneurinibacillus aneurinilyticus]MED0740690.1 TauD/TfdA family dioxygenase [Aneurinibacillus aneurinilyticus]